MLKAFQDYINDHQLLAPGAKVIVALSGGIDSVILTHLLWKSKYKLEIAHCNFNLRGKEADDDQVFAMNLAEALNVPFHIQSFNTREYAEEKNISLQMAARELRFGWFKHLQKHIPESVIALAHHRDDQVETQLLNLLRGTGFAGLRGMKNKRGIFIRPLLFATREEIERFAVTNSISWREDASNKKTKYKRNFVRHKILPLFSNINPAYRDAFAKLEQHANWAEKALEEKRFFFQKKCLTSSGEKILIYLMKWHLLSESEFFMKLIMADYGFSGRDIGELFKHYPPQVGTQLQSKTHKLLVNRDHWLLYPLHLAKKDATYMLQGDEGLLETEQFRLKWKVIHEAPFPEISKEANEVTLSIPSAYQELSLRFWQEGDRFSPLGMKGEKKLSDFFIDSKIDLDQKNNIPLLCIDGAIAWVCGLRPAEPFKHSKQAQKVLWAHFEQRS
ncbi:MAG: cell-cycle protein [Chitinophagaceae bacterium]|nr:cell-cycle protein [Chitinophagaceae bacterium]